MKRTEVNIRVSIPSIKEAMVSKDAFEALAFCLYVKLNVTSSVLYDATCRKLKDATHLGTAKINRLLSYCEAHGMIERDGKKIVFKALPHDGRLLYKFRNVYARRRKKNREKQGLSFNLTLSRVKDMLRRAVLANHIKVIEDIRQAHLLTSNPSCVADYKKAKRLQRSLVVWGWDFYLSNKRMAKVMNCCVSKAKAIKRKMLSQGEIVGRACNKLLCDDADLFNINLFFQRFGTTNFIFRGVEDNKVYLHKPNIYDYKGKNILVLKNNY